MYQVEIDVVKGENHDGKPRTVCIRGPIRHDKKEAEMDGNKLEEACKDGAQAVRSVANALQRSKRPNN